MLYYSSRLPRKISIKRLDEVISFAIDYLGLDDDILLHIEFSDSISQLGLIEGKDDDEYTVLINRKTSKKDIIETLFHELTHLKQIHSGEFDQDRRTWRGKEYHGGYFSLPWEKDAYYHEEIMSQKFFEKDQRDGTRLQKTSGRPM